MTKAGIHPQFQIARFGTKEQQIIDRFSEEWLITHAGNSIKLANSEYSWFLMKPTEIFSEMFNISREIIVVFTPYLELQPRSMDAFDVVQKPFGDLRIESVCRILVSGDENAEDVVVDLLKSDPEQPIVIPFTYSDLLFLSDRYLIVNRFRKHFYERNLFSFLSPLRKDLYFFGRNQLLQEIVNRYRSGEHTGLFGLRKSGKTSIVYAIERHLKRQKIGPVISLDCESPSVHRLRWYELLSRLVTDYKSVTKSKYKMGTEKYSETTAADRFTEDVLGIYRSRKNRQTLLILFDEIERISPVTGSSAQWYEGEDFVFFWQTLRAFFQRNPDVLTYIVVGTNPTCIELPRIGRHENPLFRSIHVQYVPSFTIEQTREMVSKLGHYMGLEFEEILYSRLVSDFGGHPFLIRQFCSQIHEMCRNMKRPVLIDRALYSRIMEKFRGMAVDYLEMIVDVLQTWYKDEHDMLMFLARGDNDVFNKFAEDNMRYTKHLIGYGLITHSVHGYSFNIEALREYVSRSQKYEKLSLSSEEKRNEISARRNRIEIGLRDAIRKALLVSQGRKKASQSIRNALAPKRREVLEQADIDILLSKDASPLYFNELIAVVKREWNDVKNVFGDRSEEKKKMEIMLEEINLVGRPDAHARSPDEDDFVQLRLYFKRLEKMLNRWNG